VNYGIKISAIRSFRPGCYRDWFGIFWHADAESSSAWPTTL